MKIIKYSDYLKLRKIDRYNPSYKIRISPEYGNSILIRAGNKALFTWGLVSILMYSLLLGFRNFIGFRKRESSGKGIKIRKWKGN